jgi:hypothetical protein
MKEKINELKFDVGDIIYIKDKKMFKSIRKMRIAGYVFKEKWYYIVEESTSSTSTSVSYYDGKPDCVVYHGDIYYVEECHIISEEEAMNIFNDSLKREFTSFFGIKTEDDYPPHVM